MQESLLALAFAEMGYPEASRRRAAQIPATSVRMLSEIRVRLTSGQALAARGKPVAATKLLRECEDFLHRGIECGALADPWNALGFQGLFPLFTLGLLFQETRDNLWPYLFIPLMPAMWWLLIWANVRGWINFDD